MMLQIFVGGLIFLIMVLASVLPPAFLSPVPCRSCSLIPGNTPETYSPNVPETYPPSVPGTMNTKVLMLDYIYQIKQATGEDVLDWDYINKLYDSLDSEGQTKLFNGLYDTLNCAIAMGRKDAHRNCFAMFNSLVLSLK